ncbi:MAG: tetratricopeptide repeat protein [Pyrinomonadaceae bacterium]
MNKKAFWLSIIGIIISFAGGFFLANALNRKEIDDLRAENGRLKTSQQTAPDASQGVPVLSDEEIQQKLDQADKNPDNTEFQKNLATALYRYAAMKHESKWLNDVKRLLTRVYEKNPKDYSTMVSLGNIYLDTALETAQTDIVETKNDTNKNLTAAREFYQKALQINPKDEDVRVDLGLTYLNFQPPETDRAFGEFQKILKANPKNQKALESIAKTLIMRGNLIEAENYLNKLKEIDPNDEALPDLQNYLNTEKNNK